MLSAEALAQLADAAAADGVQQLVVAAVIRRGAGVPLLKRPVDDFMGGIWELPSGKVEPGEALDRALAREVLEETGLALTESQPRSAASTTPPALASAPGSSTSRSRWQPQNP